MSEGGGLESFSMEEQGLDAAALERLREQMRKAQAQAKRDQKREADQSKKEDNLSQVLTALLRKQQGGFVRVISIALAANIPAYFIMAIIALRFQTVRKEVGLDFGSIKAERSPETSDSKSLVPGNFSNSALPLKTRLEMDMWLKFVIGEAQKQPHKVLNKIQILFEDGSKQASQPLKNLISYIIQDYLQQQKQEFIGQNILAFANNFSDSLVEYLTDYTKDQKQVSGAEEQSE